jgi:hypothetical protein
MPVRSIPLPRLRARRIVGLTAAVAVALLAMVGGALYERVRHHLEDLGVEWP